MTDDIPTKTGWQFFLLLALCSCVATFYSSSMELQYNQLILAQNQDLFRIFTSHLAHTNTMHYTMNMVGLLLIGLLHSHYYKVWQWLISYMILSFVITVGLYKFDHDVEVYLGLSGILHGFLMIGCMTDTLRGLKSGTVLLICVIIKITYEQMMPPNYDLEELIQANVAINAHLMGAIGGAILSFLLPFMNTGSSKKKKKKKKKKGKKAGSTTKAPQAEGDQKDNDAKNDDKKDDDNDNKADDETKKN
tara:strand:- start:2740 stop:3483 length:744 start_codon:yes stop_codon:yes gene_type:complete